MRAVSFAVGLFLLADGLRLYLSATLEAGFNRFFPYLIVGGALLYFSGFKKRIFLSPEGVVRESKSWTGSTSQLLPWKDVAHVTVAFRKNQMMCFFERREGVTGIKVLFDRDQEEAIRNILATYCPTVEVNTLS
jgi:hypothetical protein